MPLENTVHEVLCAMKITA